MKKAVTEELGKAAYEARRQKLITGAYRNSAVRVPDAEHFYEWDDMPGDVESAVKWLYRSQGEASVHAYFFYIALNGSPKAKAALSVLVEETKTLMYTEEEQARMESDEREKH
jgi:hypothetical protein